VGRSDDGRAVSNQWTGGVLALTFCCRFAEMYRKQSANPAASGVKALADDAEAEAVSDDEVLDEET
jgi:hypothetical protein